MPPLPPKRWPSPEDLVRALVEAKQRFGCRYLEKIDADADDDTLGREWCDEYLRRLLRNKQQ